MGLIPTEKKCFVCGREFIGFDQWIFKRGDKWFCKYSCLQKYDEEHKSRYVKRLNQDERNLIREKLIQGMDVQELSELFGISVRAVKHYQRQVGGLENV